MDTKMVFLLGLIVVLATPGVKSDCMLNDIPTQDNFNFERFMGLWYEVKWYWSDKPDPSEWMSDKILHGVQTDEKSATFYTRGRTSGASSCQHGVNQLTQQGTDAKLQMTSSGSTTPLWIIATDYDEYAFVYSCVTVSNSGSCSNARTTVWSRTKALSQSALEKIEDFYRNICVQESEFETVTFEKTCDIKTHVSLDPDNKCLVNDLQPKSNFDITKFAGKWYEIKYMVNQPVTQNNAWWDMVHYFNYDQHMNVTDNVYFRTKETMETCMNIFFKWKTSSIPGTYLENEDKHMVMETDYSQYALLYKCVAVGSDGRCKQAASRILSRTTDLPSTLIHQLHKTLQGMCVNPSVYLTIYHKNACEFKTHVKPSSASHCLVEDIKPQRNFDINKFAGKWYEIKYMVNQPATQNNAWWDIFHYINFRNRDMDVTDNIFFRTKETNACSNVMLEWKKTSAPGVFMEHNDKMFVVKTDYSQYALLYKCVELEPDGRCKQAASRILSRTTELPADIEEQLFATLQGMCVNPSVYLTARHTKECEFKTHVKPSSETQCLVKDLQPQHNFDITKFAGKWYEIKHMVNQPATQSSAWWDMVHFYRYDSVKGVTDNAYFRTKETGACTHVTLDLEETSTPGVFIEANSEMFVVKTDYSQYALLYKCVELEPDGRCKQAASRILSRTTELPAYIEEQLFATLQGMCVNPSVYLTARHTKECSLDEMDGSSAGSLQKTCWQTLLLLSLVFLLKN